MPMHSRCVCVCVCVCAHVCTCMHACVRVCICVICIPLYQENVEVRVARIFNTYGPKMHMYDGRPTPYYVWLYKYM